MGVSGLKKDTIIFGIVLLFSLALFNAVTWYEPYLYRVFTIDVFLTWHISLELLSIVMSASIFFISYYTFEKSHRLRTMVIACTFCAVSLIDMFHTLSYRGMPNFLTEASTAKATTFWIIARMIAAIGLLAAGIIPIEKRIRSYRSLPLLGTLIGTGLVLYFVTYHLDSLPVLFINEIGLTPLKLYLEYAIIGIQLLCILVFARIYLIEQDERGYSFIIIGLMVSIFSELAFTLYASVYDTYNLLGHIYKIIAYYLLFKALYVLNVQKPYLIIREAERKISNYADNLEKLVEQRTQEIAAANDKIMLDLDYARNIQRALLPTSFPKVLNLEFAASYVPCEKIGGDFYNIYRLDDDNIGILIGDVAGHGVSAAMITVFIHQNIYVRREYDDGRVKILTPKQVLTNLYYVYNRMTFPDEIYTVLFYGILNIQTNTLTYCSAGMNTQPLILNATGEVEKLEVVGLPICKLGTHVNPAYENQMRVLHPGDALILFTDGLVEIDRNQPDIFSEENVMEYLKGSQNTTPKEIVEVLMDAYTAILADKNMVDDVTVLIVKMNPEFE